MKKFLLILPFITALAVYYVACDNFFVYDDFIWLYRGKSLGQNWRQMFQPEVLYFDPLVYLVFFVDWLVAPLNPVWSHAVDLTLHAVNAVLLYRLIRLLSDDEWMCLYGSVLFASSFVVADAVLWSSSRVDLLAILFSLVTMLLFLTFLRSGRRCMLWLACVAFVLALGAKGTPVVLPLVLYWLLRQEKQVDRDWRAILPFGALTLLYLVLLMVTLPAAPAGQQGGLYFNPRNLALAIAALFLPEQVIADLNPAVFTLFLAVPLLVVGFGWAGSPTAGVRRTGFLIMFAGLLPVLVIRDFKLVTSEAQLNLLSSPSHRIYLASVGLALLGGGAIRLLEIRLKELLPKATVPVTMALLFVIVSFNASEVRSRDSLWENAGKEVELRLAKLLNFRERVVEDGFIGLVNFPGARGFLNPMLKVYFDLDRVMAEQVMYVGMTNDPDKLARAERSAFFVFSNDLQVIDLTDDIKALLLACRQAVQHRASTAEINHINGLTLAINRRIDQFYHP